MWYVKTICDENWHAFETKVKFNKKYQFHTLYHYLAVFNKVVHDLYEQLSYFQFQ
jgi:hypothetical protein